MAIFQIVIRYRESRFELGSGLAGQVENHSWWAFTPPQSLLLWMICYASPIDFEFLATELRKS